MGENNDPTTEPIAKAKLAYDCNTKKLCVAAYYFVDFLATNWPAVAQEDENSWIQFSGGSKLKESSASVISFSYAYRSSGEDAAVGYEGCW